VPGDKAQRTAAWLRRAPPSSSVTSWTTRHGARHDLQAGGYAAHFLHRDVTVPEDWSAAVQAAEGRFGQLDILVNDAGVVRVTPIVD
jgi:NAD(P)-dependent dehydrogenase (short-subunit alcohol dehydrogenase family)